MTERDDIGSSGKAVALEQRETAEDGRRYSPSAGRNKQVISDVLGAHMPMSGHILEVASGTGEHGAHFEQQSVRKQLSRRFLHVLAHQAKALMS